MHNSKYLESLKLNSLSNTAVRQLVFSVLSSNTQPLSMNELIAFCNKVDRVSVYRTIDIFEKIGIVSRINLGWKYKLELSDNFKEHHHHLSCNVCGAIVDFEEPETLNRELEKIALIKNFIVEQHALELRGTCIDCQIKQNAKQLLP